MTSLPFLYKPYTNVCRDKCRKQGVEHVWKKLKKPVGTGAGWGTDWGRGRSKANPESVMRPIGHIAYHKTGWIALLSAGHPIYNAKNNTPEIPCQRNFTR
jgi:hypothetical protein